MSDWPGRIGRIAFWAAAILTTGLSPLTLGKSGFNMARELSVYTIAALIIYGGLIVVCARLAAERGQRAAGTQLRTCYASLVSFEIRVVFVKA